MGDNGLSQRNVIPEILRTRKRVKELEDDNQAMAKEITWLREQVTKLNATVFQINIEPVVMEDK